MYLLVRPFCTVFRYDELSSIAPVHLEFFPDHLRVFVLIFREGNYVYIRRLTSEYYPVTVFETYVSMCNVELSSSVSLFRAVRLF